MKYTQILDIALKQSAEDMGCRPEDFLAPQNIVRSFHLGKNARKYLNEPISANLVSYGNNIVAAVTRDVAAAVTDYIGKFDFYHCFETPCMHWLDKKLAASGCKVCFMAEYFLPEPDRLPSLCCPYETRLMHPADFAELYTPQWGNALCEKRKQLDILGVGAYDEGRLIGLAACSADCSSMWQIGVDVLPSYRRKGVASALTSTLAKEILFRDKVPFYCSAWSNIRSVRNALKSGFLPAWVEMTVKPARIVDEINK